MMNFLTPSLVALAALAIMSTLLLIAAYNDYRSRRIPNALVFPGAILGLALNFLLPEGNGFASTLPGAAGIDRALLGMGIGLAIFLPFYLVRAMGAGDVKLMAMVGAFLGPNGAIEGAMFAFIAGGALSIAFLLHKRALRGGLQATLVRFTPARFKPAHAEASNTPPARRLPFAAAVATGVIAYALLSHSGLLSHAQILPTF
jgi:prepilin peptidase CpaA